MIAMSVAEFSCDGCTNAVTWRDFACDERTASFLLRASCAAVYVEPDCPQRAAYEATQETHGAVSLERAPHKALR